MVTIQGGSPFDMRPVEEWEPRANGAAAWPVANPVLTCAGVAGAPSIFVADPFLVCLIIL